MLCIYLLYQFVWFSLALTDSENRTSAVSQGQIYTIHRCPFVFFSVQTNEPLVLLLWNIIYVMDSLWYSGTIYLDISETEKYQPSFHFH